MWSRISILLIFLLVWDWNNSSIANSRKGLTPVKKDCELLEQAFQAFLYSTDRCVFVSMDHIDCPLTAKNQTIFTMTLGEVFNGLVFKYQKRFLCEVVFVLFEDFQKFRYFFHIQRLKSVFLPFTRIGVFSSKYENFTGVLPEETIYNEIVMNALYFKFGRILNSTHFQTEDVMTKNLVTYSDSRQLEQYALGRKQYQLHPLFDKGPAKGNDFKVSLFHCPPHVIKLDDKRTLDSYEGAEIRFIKEITRNWNVTIYDRSYLLKDGRAYPQVIKVVTSG